MAKLLLDQMTKAGDLGNAELEHLADIFARVGSNARNAGLSMTDTLALIEQMSLVEKQPERLATLGGFNSSPMEQRELPQAGRKGHESMSSTRQPAQCLRHPGRDVRQIRQNSPRTKCAPRPVRRFRKTDLDTQRGVAMMLQQKASHGGRP